MSVPLQSSTASRPSILVIEEYDALAAAIKFALKRFAPAHNILVTDSLTDAEIVATEKKPDVLIIDFDPSYPNLTAFLQKMRREIPDARALVLAAAIPGKLAIEKSTLGALRFVSKPYEISDFSEAVTAALNAPKSLRFLGLADIVALQCAGKRSAVIDVRGSGGDSGSIHIVDGQIVHAETEDQHGKKALREMFAWSGTRISETAKRSAVPRTIHGAWASVFLEACQWSNSVTETEADAVSKTGKKIVVIDDTEMLLLFAEDTLSRAHPEYQITTAINGSLGLQAVERIKPDLVLLDYNLPDLNGDEVCRRLLQNKETAQIPVLMMSGHVPEMIAAGAKFENIVATIEKPFFSELLIEFVQRALKSGQRPAKPPAAEILAAPSLPVKEEAPPDATIVPPSVQPVAPKLAPPATAEGTTPSTQSSSRSRSVSLVRENEVVFGLFLEVLSMQLSPQLRMGTIRAKPASLTVSLRFPKNIGQTPPEVGFQLASTQLDGTGRISSMRLLPTARPFQPGQTRATFEIAGVAMIPNESRARVQLTPSGTTPMTMELVAHLPISAVELSSAFQLAELLLQWRTNIVHITLNPKAPEESGASFNIIQVLLDPSGKIAELLLAPIK